MPRSETAIRTAEDLPCRRTANARFDAYLMIDWSASSIPRTGADSIWWALLEWENEATGDPQRSDAPAHLVTGNCATRATLDAAGALERMLAAPATDPAVLHEEGWILGVE
jgi:hypothetical protein